MDYSPNRTASPQPIDASNTVKRCREIIVALVEFRKLLGEGGAPTTKKSHHETLGQLKEMLSEAEFCLVSAQEECR